MEKFSTVIGVRVNEKAIDDLNVVSKHMRSKFGRWHKSVYGENWVDTSSSSQVLLYCLRYFVNNLSGSDQNVNKTRSS